MKVDLVRAALAKRAASGAEAAAVAYAAVAMVLREGGEGGKGAEVLFIERAMRPDDPWSGHMAFPGGRLEGGDDSTRTAACRETREEVGLELGRAEYLGHIADLAGRSGAPKPMLVSAHAFHIDEDQPLALDPNEVRSAFWFPLAELHDEARRTIHRIPQLPDHPFPAIVVGEPERHFVWGLTYRFLEEMFHWAERPLPKR
jgi:8-oxo-dGTP pyrophosphatase MutT (NUDIX family)